MQSQLAIETLHEALSPSYNADGEVAPSRLQTSHSLPVIGRGTCGTIYALASTSTVAYKVGRNKEALWNDIKLTTRVHSAVKDFCTTIEKALKTNENCKIRIPRVPAIKDWVRDTERETFWRKNVSSFAEVGREYPSVFALSLIPTIPAQARHALSSRFKFPRAEGFDLETEFCLIRPYLGLATRKGQSLCRIDNLWNFPLTLKDLKTLNLKNEIFHLAREMAAGLAIVHWAACVNGMDMEFVLGSAQGWDDSTTNETLTDDSQPFEQQSTLSIDLRVPSDGSSMHASPLGGRLTQLYILDFDKAERLSYDHPDSAINNLVTAVTYNDPYFPDPAAKQREQRRLWNLFKSAYIETSELCIENLVKEHGKGARDWPRIFIERWEARAEELAHGQDGSFIEFG